MYRAGMVTAKGIEGKKYNLIIENREQTTLRKTNVGRMI